MFTNRKERVTLVYFKNKQFGPLLNNNGDCQKPVPSASIFIHDVLTISNKELTSINNGNKFITFGDIVA